MHKFYQNDLPTPHASIIFSESEYYYIDNIISFPSIFQGKPAIPGLEAALRSRGLPGKRAWGYIFSALSLSFFRSLSSHHDSIRSYPKTADS